MMKNMFLWIAFMVTLISANETCNESGSFQGIPEEACVQYGYICHLAFDVNSEQKVMSFRLGADQTCQTFLNTKFITTGIDGSQTNTLRLFLIEGEEYNTDALGMTLAGSLALSASNKKTMISVIYHQVGNNEYGGVRLQAISQIEN